MAQMKYSYPTLTEAMDGGLKAFNAIKPAERQETSFLPRPAIFRLVNGEYHAALTRVGYNSHQYNPFYKGTVFLGFLNQDGSLDQ